MTSGAERACDIRICNAWLKVLAKDCYLTVVLVTVTYNYYAQLNVGNARVSTKDFVQHQSCALVPMICCCT